MFLGVLFEEVIHNTVIFIKPSSKLYNPRLNICLNARPNEVSSMINHDVVAGRVESAADAGKTCVIRNFRRGFQL